MLSRILAAFAALILCCGGAAYGQGSQPNQPGDEDAVFLVANPAFRDAGYFHTVLIAAPIPRGGHIGVILNRPTNRSLTSLFPEHEPSKQVAETVRYGGPFSPGALIAVVKAQTSPGEGTLPLMKDLYIAFRAATIDKVIEQTPNDARYFVGLMIWAPNELDGEIEQGAWNVRPAEVDTVLPFSPDGLWKSLSGTMV